MQCVELVFALPLAQKFTYKLPPDLVSEVKVGVRALAPFKGKKLTGFITNASAQPPENIKLKTIVDVLDDGPVFSDELLNLAEWIADYYLCGLGEVLRAMLPAGIHLESQKTLRLINEDFTAHLLSLDEINEKILSLLRHGKQVRIDQLERKFGSQGFDRRITALRKAGLVVIEKPVLGKSSYVKNEKFASLVEDYAEKLARIRATASTQKKIVAHLSEVGGTASVKDLTKHVGASTSAIAKLKSLEIIRVFSRKVERDLYGDLQVEPNPKLILNNEQQVAIDNVIEALQDESSQTFLVHGVTGSGKTQIYIESIRHALAMGGDAIVLVPEISLTPQTVRRFRGEFQKDVAVLHSRMSKGERYDAWARIKEGRARVVIGPRSAIFAPLKNLKLIVVDEEHENSYKQVEPSPRYHARDVAVVRGSLNNAVVVLGTATPSLETYENVYRGKYRLIEIQNRIDDIPLPEVKILNMGPELRAAKKENRDVLISQFLARKIEEKLARKEQVIILQNRRGYSTSVLCLDCGYIEKCPDCNISMSYHLRGLQMRCHYCDKVTRAPKACPDCQSGEIQFYGIGTQKVEAHLQERFDAARIARMDIDTTRGKMSHDRILESFGAHQYDILVGTQMIAKGLDFPKVTLVGVISADTGLYLPDFRAGERTFQLLTQVAGRAGRKGGRGEVVIQTFSPGHYCLEFARKHDFKQFYYHEVGDRRNLKYPPFGRLALIQFKSRDQQEALVAVNAMAELITKHEPSFEMLGPSPAPLAKLQQYYRYQIILKNNRRLDASAAKMRAAIKQAADAFHSSKLRHVKMVIDIDPVTIL